MNRNKYYKVIKTTDNKGQTVYKVKSVDSIVEFIFGVWETYSKNNYSLNSAIKQIEFLNQETIIKEKLVLRKKAWSLK